MRDDQDRLRALDAAEGSGPAAEDTVRRLRQTLQVLTAFAPARRGACPDRERLVAWFDHSLAAAETARVEAHLAVCPFCAADMADLAALATPPLFEAVVQLAGAGLRLLSHTFGAAVQPRPVAVRGGAVGGAVQLGAAGEDLDLQIRLHAASPGGVDVRVLLHRGDAVLDRARLNLLRGDALLESRVVGDAEEVLFADVPPGDYTIAVLPVDGDEVARLTLQVVPEEVHPA